ncbi:MAG: flavin reductase family protein [Acidobacteriota bacterium]
MKKVDYPIDKKKWHPSLIPGPVVLISTYNSKKEPNIAPKSWLQMVSFEPPILMFSGTKGNTTERNIIEHNCFAVNFVDSSMASEVFESIKWHGKERIERTGFKIIEAKKIYAPLVDDCRIQPFC